LLSFLFSVFKHHLERTLHSLVQLFFIERWLIRLGRSHWIRVTPIACHRISRNRPSPTNHHRRAQICRFV